MLVVSVEKCVFVGLLQFNIYPVGKKSWSVLFLAYNRNSALPILCVQFKIHKMHKDLDIQHKHVANYSSNYILSFEFRP